MHMSGVGSQKPVFGQTTTNHVSGLRLNFCPLGQDILTDALKCTFVVLTETSSRGKQRMAAIKFNDYFFIKNFFLHFKLKAFIQCSGCIKAGASFQLFLGGQIFFFNATGLLKNWKNSTLYVVL